MNRPLRSTLAPWALASLAILAACSSPRQAARASWSAAGCRGCSSGRPPASRCNASGCMGMHATSTTDAWRCRWTGTRRPSTHSPPGSGTVRRWHGWAGCGAKTSIRSGSSLYPPTEPRGRIVRTGSGPLAFCDMRSANTCRKVGAEAGTVRRCAESRINHGNGGCKADVEPSVPSSPHPHRTSGARLAASWQLPPATGDRP